MQQVTPTLQLLISGGSIANDFGFALGFGGAVLALSFVLNAGLHQHNDSERAAGVLFVSTAAALANIGIALGILGQTAVLWGLYSYWGSAAQLSVPLFFIVALLYTALVAGAIIVARSGNVSVLGWSLAIMAWVLIKSTQLVPAAAMQSPQTVFGYGIFIALFIALVYGLRRYYTHGEQTATTS